MTTTTAWGPERIAELRRSCEAVRAWNPKNTIRLSPDAILDLLTDYERRGTEIEGLREALRELRPSVDYAIGVLVGLEREHLPAGQGKVALDTARRLDATIAAIDARLGGGE